MAKSKFVWEELSATEWYCAPGVDEVTKKTLEAEVRQNKANCTYVIRKGGKVVTQGSSRSREIATANAELWLNNALEID